MTLQWVGKIQVDLEDISVLQKLREQAVSNMALAVKKTGNYI